MMRYSIRDVSRFAAGVHQPDGRLSGISGHLHSGGLGDDTTPFDWSSLDPLIAAGSTIAQTVIQATTPRPPAPAGYAYNASGTLVPIAGATSTGFLGLSPMLLLGGGALLLFALSRK